MPTYVPAESKRGRQFNSRKNGYSQLASFTNQAVAPKAGWKFMELTKSGADSRRTVCKIRV